MPRTRRAFLSVAATAVAAGCGAVGSGDAPLALDGSASVRWRATVDGEPSVAAPPDPDAPVYAVTDGVRAFAREDGAPVGRFDPEGRASVLTADEASVVLTTGGTGPDRGPTAVHGLGPRCYHRWRADPGDGPYAVVAATADTVYVGSRDDQSGSVDALGDGDHAVFALDRDDGGIRWAARGTPDTWGGRHLDTEDGTRLLVRAPDGLFALADGGELVWRTPPHGRGATVVAGDTVLTAGNDVVARSVGDGYVRWRHDGAGANHVVAATPARAFVGDEDGFAARATTDGSRLWRTAIDGTVGNVTVAGGGGVLAATRGGRLHALDRESGERRWTTAVPLAARTERGPGPWLWADRGRTVVHGQPAGPETPADPSDHGRTVALTADGERRWTATARHPLAGPAPASRGVYLGVGGAVLLVTDSER